MNKTDWRSILVWCGCWVEAHTSQHLWISHIREWASENLKSWLGDGQNRDWLFKIWVVWHAHHEPGLTPILNANPKLFFAAVIVVLYIISWHFSPCFVNIQSAFLPFHTYKPNWQYRLNRGETNLKVWSPIWKTLSYNFVLAKFLTGWGLDKMDNILQTFLMAFSWKIFFFFH